MKQYANVRGFSIIRRNFVCAFFFLLRPFLAGAGTAPLSDVAEMGRHRRTQGGGTRWAIGQGGPIPPPPEPESKHFFVRSEPGAGARPTTPSPT